MTTSALSRMLETEELSAFGGILKKFPQRGHILTTAHVRELVIGNVVRRVLSRSARMRRGSRRHVRRHTADARRAGGAGGRLRRADHSPAPAPDAWRAPPSSHSNKVEAFLKTAAKKRQFKVIIVVSAPSLKGQRTAKARSSREP
ncbi:hypothetical protein PF003_g14778 [Phytophthora fragariae]|nr:hypothetical protein PF003_g14778 [Phytophthora fragariae]